MIQIHVLASCWSNWIQIHWQNGLEGKDSSSDTEGLLREVDSCLMLYRSKSSVKAENFVFFFVWINCLKLKSGFIVNTGIESFQNYYFFDDFLLRELNFKMQIIFWSQFHDKSFGFCVNWLSFRNCTGDDNISRDFGKLTMLTNIWHIC